MFNPTEYQPDPFEFHPSDSDPVFERPSRQIRSTPIQIPQFQFNHTQDMIESQSESLDKLEEEIRQCSNELRIFIDAETSSGRFKVKSHGPKRKHYILRVHFEGPKVKPINDLLYQKQRHLRGLIKKRKYFYQTSSKETHLVTDSSQGDHPSDNSFLFAPLNCPFYSPSIFDQIISSQQSTSSRSSAAFSDNSLPLTDPLLDYFSNPFTTSSSSSSIQSSPDNISLPLNKAQSSSSSEDSSEVGLFQKRFICGNWIDFNMVIPDAFNPGSFYPLALSDQKPFSENIVPLLEDVSSENVVPSLENIIPSSEKPILDKSKTKALLSIGSSSKSSRYIRKRKDRGSLRNRKIELSKYHAGTGPYPEPYSLSEETILIERRAVGLILTGDMQGNPLNVRCFHSKNGQALICDCDHQDNVFILSETSRSLKSKGLLVINQDILYLQRLDLLQNRVKYGSVVKPGVSFSCTNRWFNPSHHPSMYE